MSRAGNDDPLMPIGMFSRASLVSIKALRAYHDQGLLVPDSVDPHTGYRSYRVSQLGDAAIVKRLRDLDMPLRDVAEIIAARDPNVTHRVVAAHELVMRERLGNVARIVDALQEPLERPEFHTPVHVRAEPAVHALTFEGRVEAADYATFLDHAYTTLFAAVEMVGAAPIGSGSARYPASVDTDSEPVEAYIPIAKPVPVPRPVQQTGVNLALVPSATCAVATHLGGYDAIGETYRRLGAWVARNATSASQPVREHYVVSTDPVTRTLLAPDQLRTEISWPIKDEPTPIATHESDPTNKHTEGPMT
jgi:DNA-binding transcriptional MerR regulator